MSDSANAADTITIKSVPQHIAIIMDGNGRWAQRRGLNSSAGHRAGVEAVRGVLKACIDRGINVVSLFAFSSENWQRPALEVKALMSLFASYLKKEAKQLHADNVRLRFIGGRDRFSKALLKQMEQAEQLTAGNDGATLVLAIDYGGQWDIANAAKLLAKQVQAGQLDPERIDTAMLDRYTALADLPKPDLCIRTAAEQRISNFMLWQLAYAELYFADVLWPDFSERDLDLALRAYAGRERRFGGRLDGAIAQAEAGDA